MGVTSYKSQCDSSGEVVMTKIELVQCLIQQVWCHSWSGCEVIKIVAWCDRVDVTSCVAQMVANICRVWCNHTQGCVALHSGYDVINIVERMSHIYWMWYHTYSGCDIIYRVGVMTDTVDMMSNILGLMSSKCWFEVKKRGCDVLYNANDATHMASVMS